MLPDARSCWHMAHGPDRRPGDIILDRFAPHLGSEDREITRERLQRWMRWKLHVYMDQVRADMHSGDSPEPATGDTMDSATSPSP